VDQIQPVRQRYRTQQREGAQPRHPGREIFEEVAVAHEKGEVHLNGGVRENRRVEGVAAALDGEHRHDEAGATVDGVRQAAGRRMDGCRMAVLSSPGIRGVGERRPLDRKEPSMAHIVAAAAAVVVAVVSASCLDLSDLVVCKEVQGLSGPSAACTRPGVLSVDLLDRQLP